MPLLVESAQKSQHGTWIEIRLDRLRANLHAIKQCAGPATSVLAVIKANAYGHGLIGIARALQNQVAYLGVSSVAEALELKEHQIESPIFLFGRVLAPELPAVLVDGITLSISDLEEAEAMAALSRSLARKTAVHIKVDTGMGRLGIPLRDAEKIIPKIAALDGLRVEGIYTHFPTAERGDGFTETQVREFAALLESLENKGISFRWRHAANSAGSLKIRTPIFNLIRPGLMLYGLYPDPSLAAIAAVSPILSLKSRIILLKRINTGETVGYGREFVATKPTTIATLPIGYSHGYPFQAAKQGSVLYQGKRFPIAGRVSMDYITIDLGDEQARIGDEVTLIGEDGSESIRAEEIAQLIRTIPYEIVTRLPSRLPRFYRPQ